MDCRYKELRGLDLLARVTPQGHYFSPNSFVLLFSGIGCVFSTSFSTVVSTFFFFEVLVIKMEKLSISKLPFMLIYSSFLLLFSFSPPKLYFEVILSQFSFNLYHLLPSLVQCGQARIYTPIAHLLCAFTAFYTYGRT